MFNYYWKTCHIPCRCFVPKDIGTWRTPRRVNMEQNMQWRRQGVNRESATVITCIDFNVPTFWFYSIILSANKRKQSFMCWYHNSKSNWEASDGSLPGMWKLVIILNNFRTSTFICQFLFPPRSWTWLQGCPDLGDIRRRKIPSVLHWVSCSRGTAPGNGLCPLADLRWTAGTSQCRLPQGTWTLPCFEAKHQNPLSTIWEDKSRSFVHLPFNVTCQRREKQGSWEMRQWSWQPRGLTGHWQWWCSTSSPFTAPLQRLASTPPGNLPHRAVCYDCLLRMRALKRRWKSSSLVR